MKKASSANLKPKYGKKLYEPWMDYKEDLQPSTPGTTPSAPAAPAGPPRYRFNSEYAESVSLTPSVASASTKRAPPVIRTPSGTPTRTPTRTPTHTPATRKSTPKPASKEQTSTGTKQLVRRTPTPPPPYPQSADYSHDKK
ncbi:hypothetical protein ANCDUO_25081, partial [Ancylostoma duodenale]